MKCNETVTISLESYKIMTSEIIKLNKDITELNNDLLLVLKKNKKHSIKVTTPTYFNRIDVDIYTDSDLVIDLQKRIDSNEMQIENLTTLLGTKDSEIEHLESIKQTSILWGLIKFNKK